MATVKRTKSRARRSSMRGWSRKAGDAGVGPRALLHGRFPAEQSRAVSVQTGYPPGFLTCLHGCAVLSSRDEKDAGPGRDGAERTPQAAASGARTWTGMASNDGRKLKPAGPFPFPQKLACAVPPRRVSSSRPTRAGRRGPEKAGTQLRNADPGTSLAASPPSCTPGSGPWKGRPVPGNCRHARRVRILGASHVAKVGEGHRPAQDRGSARFGRGAPIPSLLDRAAQKAAEICP